MLLALRISTSGWHRIDFDLIPPLDHLAARHKPHAIQEHGAVFHRGAILQLHRARIIKIVVLDYDVDIMS
jgi:hypothetical protein